MMQSHVRACQSQIQLLMYATPKGFMQKMFALDRSALYFRTSQAGWIVFLVLSTYSAHVCEAALDQQVFITGQKR